jgi:hypothetical protein
MRFIRNFVATVLLFAVLLSTPSAFADAAAAPTAWWAPIADRLIEMLGVVLATLLGALLLKGLKKLGVSTTAETQAMYDQAVFTAIGAAEEWAHKQVAQHGKTAPNGDEKLQQAVSAALKLIDQYGLEKKGEDWVKDRIHAVLGMNRSPVLKSIAVGTLSSVTPPPPPPA